MRKVVTVKILWQKAVCTILGNKVSLSARRSFTNPDVHIIQQDAGLREKQREGICSSDSRFIGQLDERLQNEFTKNLFQVIKSVQT